jgi:hypothetical protein
MARVNRESGSRFGLSGPEGDAAGERGDKVEEPTAEGEMNHVPGRFDLDSEGSDAE